MIDIDWNPTEKKLRIFAAIFFVIAAMMGYWGYRLSGSTTVGWSITGVGFFLAVLSLVSLPVCRAVYIGWMGLCMPIGWVLSYFMLIVLFFFVVTPIGLLMKLVRRDPMQRQLEPGRKSYWEAKKTRSPNTDRYFRQF